MMLISILLLPLKELPLAFICSRKSPFLKDHFTGIMTICTIDNLMCLSVALYDVLLIWGSLGLLYLDVFSLQVCEAFSHYCFKFISCPFLLEFL